MTEHNKDHWQELITTIVNRIGADAFLRLSAAVLGDVNEDLKYDLKALADTYTRGKEEEYPYSGHDKDEWKHEAETWQRLKR